MLDQDKILNFLKTTGPTLPSKVAKYIGSEIFIASAHLSMLASQGKIIISKLKVGGSPLYYLPGQEQQLFPFAAGNINPKELQVLERLKEEKVMREADLDLLKKVALRSLKDFATPLHVTVKGRRELFWRWYLLSAEDTKQAIGEILRQQEEKQDQPETDESASAATAETDPTAEDPTEDKVMPAEILRSGGVIEKSGLVVTTESILPETLIQEKQKKLSAVGRKRERKLEMVSELKSIKNSNRSKGRGILNVPGIASTDGEPMQNDLLTASREVSETNQTVETKLTPVSEMLEKKSILDKPKTKKIVVEELKPTEDHFNSKKIKDNLLPIVTEYLGQLNIFTKAVDVVRRNTELNLRVEVPSVVGKMEYFCKVRKKHRIDEKDVSAAYMEAQIQKLPLLFLYTHQITKKAEEMLKMDAFLNVVVKKIE